MSSRVPTRVTFSFDTFSRRGGRDGPHRDGWGVAFFHGRDVQLLREDKPAAQSPTVQFLQQYPIESSIVVSHIRLATVGSHGICNTQPFTREVFGRRHVFAHNGHVPGAIADPRLARGTWRPVGDTDSEHAFCALLERIAPLWRGREQPPSVQERRRVVTSFAAELSEHGPANFIYSDGDVVFAHGNRRTQSNKEIRPPGLYVLCRSCVESSPQDGSVSVAPRGRAQDVVLFASVPLTDERWRPLEEGEVVTARAGSVDACAELPTSA
jgi:glutamine amidotransferase